LRDAQSIFSGNVFASEGSGGLSKEVADRFVEALRELEQYRNVEALVEIHAEGCPIIPPASMAIMRAAANTVRCFKGSPSPRHE
jgi:hypothetical protein